MQKSKIEEMFLIYLNKYSRVLHYKYKKYNEQTIESTLFNRVLNYTESYKEDKNGLTLPDELIISYDKTIIVEYDVVVIPQICINMNSKYHLDYLLTDEVLESVIRNQLYSKSYELKRIPYLRNINVNIK